MQIKDAIAKLVGRESLSEEEAYQCMKQIMEGEATHAQIAAFLVALRMKGESVSEIVGFVRCSREKAERVQINEPLLDTCGTGGDGLHTFNISTLCAFVAAGAGAMVGKHGNRSVSSRCGSIDLLESLGVKVELGPQQVRRCIQEVGIGFFFAPLFHPAMKQVLPVRRQMGIRTVFNIIGPLTNPAFAKRQLLGVYNPGIAETLGQTLKELGSEKVFIVHGGMGEDEVSLCAPTKVVRLSDGKIDTFFFEPEQIRVKRCASINELRGGTPEENAKIALSILEGEKSARTDAVIVNAAFAIVAAGLCEDLIEAKERAEESIQSGKALEKLHTLQRFTNAIG